MYLKPEVVLVMLRKACLTKPHIGLGHVVDFQAGHGSRILISQVPFCRELLEILAVRSFVLEEHLQRLGRLSPKAS